eukprot:919578-Prymnesium_polylepis.1
MVYHSRYTVQHLAITPSGPTPTATDGAQECPPALWGVLGGGGLGVLEPRVARSPAEVASRSP